ncbi:MAG: peptidoglycan glycosyltransferase (Penicillin-binding protein) [Pseudonocardiales bacterium]|nr:peptidoglycan glycosyltransferase (Penicillin-binding protein) [Pseudonocardiales bacterium]
MEKLQKGGPKRVRADNTPLRERLAHLPTWWKKRRQAKKKRLAAMSRRRRILRRIGLLGTWFLGFVAVLTVATVVLFYTLSNVPRPESLPLPQVATILYSDGSVMARIGDVNRTIVKLEQVPAQVRWDVLAAEDRGFYKNPGVSIKSTLRAALSDLTGGNTQGGSGITQQYAKNAYLSDAHTLTRKLKELMIAVKLARQYSKDQILEFYLNTVYFGRGVYGIQAAAQSYFGRDVSRLSVAQGAVLAALLRAPSYYDPAVNPSAAKARWQYVLDGMVSTGHLTRAQEAKLRFPKVLPPKDTTGLGATGPNALIVQRVLAELDAHGISEAEIYARGLRIQTTIDPKAQQAARTAVDQTFANLTPQQRNLKNALVAVNPANGAVLAYYGGPNGKNYAGKIDNFDYAGLGSRPPGSSFKPFTLATALTQTLQKASGKPHYTIDSYVDGSYQVTIDGTVIKNDPGDASVSSSSVSIRNAMKYSLNTTFDQMAFTVGPANVAATAHAAGVPKSIDGRPSLVGANGKTGFGIGIGDYAVRPLDQAVGFATLANNGTRNDAYFVQKATDSSGAVVYQHKSAAARALDPKVANDVTLTLEPIAGWSNDPLSGGRVSAAKTGTEGIQNDPRGNNSDAWMVGYTPQVSAAVWTGSGNSTTPIYNSYGGAEYGSDLPGKTWKMFMDTYLADKASLPMATTQMITGGQSTATVPVTTPTPTPTKSKTPSKTPTPTFSRRTGFSSVPAPTTPTPTPTTSIPATPTPVCTTSVLGPPPTCTTPPAAPTPGG